MNKADTRLAIMALGLVATWSSEWQEWIINYRRDDPRFVSGSMGSSYHTTDNGDALDTAKHMAQR